MRRLGCLVIFCLIGFIAYKTNPTEQEHIDNAYKILKENGVEDYGINSDYLTIGEGLLGKDKMDKFLDNFIQRKNYVLFSLTEVDLNGQKETIALGLFGKMWNIGDMVDLVDRITTWTEEQIDKL